MRILFVCLGNICRSPTAEAVLRQLASAQPLAGLEIDSAGTGGYHAGHPPDPRTLAAARRRGLAMDSLRARKLERADFQRFDLILAMDRQNLIDCERIAPTPRRAQLKLFLEFAPACGYAEVPDPYNGEAADFERVLDLAEAGCRGLLEYCRTLPATAADRAPVASHS
ncbi:MAG: low molecular weight protein-tyrosine-phosphatase [Steroidobacteraceae bacterium]|jgi:protein-tyrosine phosphatase